MVGFAGLTVLGGAVWVGPRAWERFRPRYELPCAAPGQVRLELRGRTPGDEFGSAVSPFIGRFDGSDGDVNGDGRADFAVSGVFDDGPSLDCGRMLFVSGRDGSTLSDLPGTELSGRFGYGLGGGVDIDGDGTTDVLVGCMGEGKALGGSGGAVRLVSGRDGTTLRTWTGTSEGDEFGHAVTFVGDLDGDGSEDIAVSAPGSYRGERIGAVSCFSGTDGHQILTLPGHDVGDRFGFALTGGADFDGDGRPDLVVGSLDGAWPKCGPGTVTVISGRTGETLRKVSGAGGDQLGHALDIVPDVDGDGTPEILVGAFNFRDVGYVRLLSGKDLSTLREWRTGLVDDGFGHSVAYVGDVDGDGRPDVAVGAPRGPRDGVREVGAVYVYCAVDGTQVMTHAGRYERGRLGYVVTRLGDTDGDGRDEFAAGSSVEDDRPGFLLVLGMQR